MSERSKWWSRIWRGWIAFFVLYELVAITIGSSAKPLTKVLRRRVLHKAAGSFILIGFLGWAIYHLGWDARGGLSWIDGVVFTVSGYLGLLGLEWRLQEDAPFKERLQAVIAVIKKHIEKIGGEENE
jgi:hypothetical protein